MTYSRMRAFLVGGALGFGAGVATTVGAVAFDITHQGKALRYILSIRSDGVLSAPVPEQPAATPTRD
jgi:hypothetical protein